MFGVSSSLLTKAWATLLSAPRWRNWTSRGPGVTPRMSVAHQSSRRSQTTEDWVASLSRYGPVVTGGLFLKVRGSSFSQMCLGRMVIPPQMPTAGKASRLRWNRGLGDDRLNVTVRSSTFSTEATASLASTAHDMEGF